MTSLAVVEVSQLPVQPIVRPIPAKAGKVVQVVAPINQGPAGKDGKDGVNGKDGKDGVNGKDGTTVASVIDVPGLVTRLDPLTVSRVLATKDYRFRPGFVPEANTFARASTATYFDPMALLRAAASGAPRFWANPATGENLGILIEDQRTNTVTASEVFESAAYAKQSSTLTPNAAIAPDGTITADKWVPNNGVLGYLGAPQTNHVAGTPYTFSIFVKAANTTVFTMLFGAALYTAGAANRSVRFDLAAKSFTLFNLNAATDLSATITDVGNGWFRCTATILPGVSGNSVSQLVRASVNGDGTNGLFVWGCQIETAAAASAYIPTAGTAVTRAADSLIIPTAVDWFNPLEGTFYADANALIPAGLSQSLSQVDDGTGNNRLSLARNTAGQMTCQVVAAGSTVASLNLGAIPADGACRVAFSYKKDAFFASMNGGGIQFDTLGDLPTGLTNWRIGSNSAGNKWNGGISRMAYLPRALSSTALQRVTA